MIKHERHMVVYIINYAIGRSSGEDVAFDLVGAEKLKTKYEKQGYTVTITKKVNDKSEPI